MKWKYFEPWEVEGISDDLVFKLDRARGFYGNPIVITSGFRTPEHNAKVGGVPNSLHTKGLAVDIRGPKDSRDREKLAWALGAAGFRQVQSYWPDGHYHAEKDDREGPWFNVVE